MRLRLPSFISRFRPMPPWVAARAYLRTLALLAGGCVIIFVLIVAVWALYALRLPVVSHPLLGITFSKKYAVELSLPWEDAYIATLEHFRPDRVRIPAYWDEIELSPGVYDFSDLDWMLNTAHAYRAGVILAVGQRVPRWPECHIPSWALTTDAPRRDEALIAYLATLRRRYHDHPALTYWQIENEPFLSIFGHCPPFNLFTFEKELSLFRAQNDHPILITESGELSTWLPASAYADVIGVSLYRKVWNQYSGFFTWPLPAFSYRMKAALAQRNGAQKVIISEVQLEPWSHEPLSAVPLDAQSSIFTPSDMARTIRYAKRAGLSEIYFWGVEWWYYMKLHGDDRYWQEAKHAFQPTPS